MLPSQSWGWEVPCHVCDLPGGLIIKENWLFLSPLLSSTNSSSASSVIFCPLFPSNAEILFYLSSYVSFVYHDNHCGFICVTALVCLDVSHRLWLLGFSRPSSPKTPGEECDVCVSMEPSSPQSHTLSMLTIWEPVLITIYCKKELLWWGFRDALIYVYSSIAI